MRTIWFHLLIIIILFSQLDTIETRFGVTAKYNYQSLSFDHDSLFLMKFNDIDSVKNLPKQIKMYFGYDIKSHHYELAEINDKIQCGCLVRENLPDFGFKHAKKSNNIYVIFYEVCTKYRANYYVVLNIDSIPIKLIDIKAKDRSSYKFMLKKLHTL